MRNGILLTVSSLLLTISPMACDDRKPESAAAPAPQAQQLLPAGLIVAQPLADAKAVVDIRKSANDGDEVVIHGRIAGQAEPFTEGRAQFQLIDSSMKSCGEADPNDKCPTPWDMCCDVKEHIVSNSVTVQVVDAQGQPIKAGLQGVAGLKPLSEVSVKGTLKKSADGKAVLVNATELYVKQG
jgi:hypothetical protein